MDSQLHQQFLDMTAQRKTVCDLLVQLETNLSLPPHGVLHLPDGSATPACSRDRYDWTGEAYIERLIGGR
jgi:hypothetical protein